MNFESMRAFKDGNQFVIVLENVNDSMEKAIMNLLNGNIGEATHLSAPAPIPKTCPNIASMKEVKAEKTEKSISANNASASVSSERKEKRDPERMTHFELCGFLENRKDDERLKWILRDVYHTDSLAFILNTKGDAELKKMVKNIL